MRIGIVCDNCGKDFTPFRNGIKFCSVKCRKVYWNKHNKDKVAIMNQNYSQTITKDQRKKYNKDFLKTHPNYVKDYLKHYSKKRELIFKVIKSTNSSFKRESQCGLCGSKENLNFHHWIYKLPVERKDFSTLCRPCHEIVHLKKKRLFG